jgi:putative intracellular protease/amidase
MARFVITPASADYDPTEVAIPWQVLSNAGHEVAFATENGTRAEADEIMLTGIGLDPWSFIPRLAKLKFVGRFLGADGRARDAHRRMLLDPRFDAPLRFDALRAEDWDGLVLPGGHRARGIRPYLESEALRRFVVAMFEANKIVGAICHGTVVAARAIVPSTGRSVLYGKQTTSLLWAQERLATRIARLTRWWDPDYYRTYVEEPGEPRGYRSVQAEVTRALASPSDFREVDRGDTHYRRKTNGLHRDTLADASCAFVVRDGRYVSARWPGDAHTFAKTLDALSL